MRKYSGFRWLELLTGIFLVVLGLWTLFRPGAALTGMIRLYGLLAVLMGVADILLGVDSILVAFGGTDSRW